MKRSTLAALALCCAFTGAAMAQEQSDKLIPSITVVGQGESNQKPDIATIQIGVTTEANTAAEALKSNTEAMRKLFEQFKAASIDDKDIQTSNFSIHPRFQHDPKGRSAPKIDGYTVNNQVTLRVRKLESLGSILDQVVTSGANNIHSISFGLADPTEAQDAARRDAVADARRKAELYAEAAGVKLGAPLVIQEATSRGIQPPVGLRMAAMSADSAVPVAAGELTTSAQITISYAIVN